MQVSNVQGISVAASSIGTIAGASSVGIATVIFLGAGGFVSKVGCLVGGFVSVSKVVCLLGILRCSI